MRGAAPTHQAARASWPAWRRTTRSVCSAISSCSSAGMTSTCVGLL